MSYWSSNLLHAVTISWHGFGGETKAAIIGAFATLLAAFAGFSAIVLQMRSQGRHSRATIIETERRKLKAGLYEEAVLVCRSVADAAINLSTELRMMKMQLEAASRARAADLDFQVPLTRFPKLAASYTIFSDAALRLMFLVETRRIIDPGIIVFRTAFGTVLHDTGDLMFSQFVAQVMPVLPVEAPNGSLYNYTPPALEGVLAIGKLVERFIGSLDDAVAYTEDFLVEMQNLLLGDLFGTHLKHRQPLDPSQKVIRLDQAEALESWFRCNTPWGQNCEQAEEEARARFASR